MAFITDHIEEFLRLIAEDAEDLEELREQTKTAARRVFGSPLTRVVSVPDLEAGMSLVSGDGVVAITGEVYASAVVPGLHAAEVGLGVLMLESDSLVEVLVR